LVCSGSPHVGRLVLAGCSDGERTEERLTEPTAEHEPPPDQRLPPRETRPELRRTTSRTPPLHRQRNALEIEPGNATLKPLPTNADQDLPTPSGPTDLKKLSHTFSLRELLQGGRDAGSAGRAGERKTPDGPKESFSLTLLFSEAQWQGGGRKAGGVTAARGKGAAGTHPAGCRPNGAFRGRWRFRRRWCRVGHSRCWSAGVLSPFPPAEQRLTSLAQ